MLIFQTNHQFLGDKFKELLSALYAMKNDYGVILLPPDCELIAVTHDDEEIRLEDEIEKLRRETQNLRMQEVFDKQYKEFIFKSDEEAKEHETEEPGDHSFRVDTECFRYRD